MPRDKAAQRKQNRLTFTPVPSSSPQAKASSSRVISNVRFDTPRKSRVPNAFTSAKSTGQAAREPSSVVGDSDDGTQLPTPDPSSQPQESTITSTNVQYRQLAATNGTGDDQSTQSEGESDSDMIRSRCQRRSKQPNDAAQSESISTEDSQSPEQTTPSRQSGRVRRHQLAPISSSDEATLAPNGGTRRSTRLTRAREKGPYPVKSNTAQMGNSLGLGEAETSDDEIMVLASKPVRKQRTHKPPTLRDDFIVGDDTIELETSEDQDMQPRVSRRAAARRRPSHIDDADISTGDSDTEPSVTPSKRKRHGHLKSPHKRNKQEEEDLEEDLEDLEDSAVKTSRTRGAPVTSARDKYRKGLEALKRSRARRSSPVQEESEQEAVEVDDEDAEEQDPEREAPSLLRHFDFADDLSASSHSEEPDQNEDLDEYEDDFIAKDDDQDIQNLLPLEFSRWATAAPRDHFRNVIEWLVKNKIAPAFDRNSELFTLSFRKINDEVRGQAGSRYISSSWGPEFKHAIEARPELETIRISNDGDGEALWMENCQACHRTSHPATWSFQFKGHAYHHDTLEPVGKEDEDSDSNSDSDIPNPKRTTTTTITITDENEASDSDTRSVDSHNHTLLPTTHAFPLGRTCAANASIAHKLSHWKYHLNQYILDLLRSNHLLTPAAIVARDAKSLRKREKEAETFVDGLDQAGEVEGLWRTWKEGLRDLRGGMEDWEDGTTGKGKGRQRGGHGQAQGGLGMWVR